jgi:hypothetical protein
MLIRWKRPLCRKNFHNHKIKKPSGISLRAFYLITKVLRTTDR